jgi:hypothetical protein
MPGQFLMQSVVEVIVMILSWRDSGIETSGRGAWKELGKSIVA